MYKCINLIGDGAYGRVYTGEKNNKQFAIKVNLIEKEFDFIGNVRELDMLKKLNGHPHIISLIEHVYDNPFDEEINHENDKYEVDKISFVMDIASCSAEDLLHSKATNILKKYDMNWCHYKQIMYQTLLGIEYMHSNNIIHRDIKADNVLLFMDHPYGRGPIPGYEKRKKGRPKKEDESSMSEIDDTLKQEIEEYKNEKELVVAKIIDFGMSRYNDNQGNTTPRTYTDSNRPPEVMLKADYDYKADIWACGIFFLELVMGKCWSYKSKRHSDVIEFLLKELPYFVKINNKYGPYMKKMKIKRTDKMKDERPSWKKRILEIIDEEKFNSSDGSLDDFCDLLNNMLQFFPETRFSATECLNHKFFDQFRQKIDEVRMNNPPTITLKEDKMNCVERDWVVALCKKIFSKRKDLKWYEHRILIHAMDLFDRYLCREYPKYINNEREITESRGKMLRQKEAWHKFLVCIYIFVKYFNTMTKCVSYKDITNGLFAEEDYTRKSLDFEKELILIFDGKLFNETEYEKNEKMDENQIEKIINNL